MRLNSFLAAGLVLALTLPTIHGCQQSSSIDELTPSLAQESKLIRYSGENIPGQFIVVLQDDALSVNPDSRMAYEEAQETAMSDCRSLLSVHGIDGEKIQHVYSQSIVGFSVGNLQDSELRLLLADPKVKYIEQDQIIRLEGGAPGGGSCATNNSESTPCGIPVVNGGAPYAGGHKAYVLDTGIDLDHADLNVASFGFNAFTSGKDANSLDDGNGHGTHVSGTIAAIANNGKGVKGVAAGALVVPVKVLGSNGSGSNSGVIAGVNYVGANGTPGDVANMSLGGGISQALDDAVLSASSDGTWFLVAAGNSSANANNYSPARVNGTYVRTIAAMTCAGSWASYSNFGVPPVDFIAPGSSICSTYKGNTYSSLSGTSMATPHAAGVFLASAGDPSTCGSVTYGGATYPKICL